MGARAGTPSCVMKWIVALCCVSTTMAQDTPPQLNISWTQVNSYLAPARRLSATLTSLGDQVVLFGGDTWACPPVIPQCQSQSDFQLRAVSVQQKFWAYDTVNKAWSMPQSSSTGDPSSPSSRSGHAAVRVSTAVASRAMLIHGGHRATDGGDQYLDGLWLYDLDVGKWKCLDGSECKSSTNGNTSPTGRAHQVLEAVPDSEQYIMYGGQTCSSGSCGSSEVWSLKLTVGTSSPSSASSVWTELSASGQAAPALYGHGAAYSAGLTAQNGTENHSGVYVFGGVTADGSVTGAVANLHLTETSYTYKVVQQAPPRCFHSLEGSPTAIFSVGGYASATNLANLVPDSTLLTYTNDGNSGSFELVQFNGTLASQQNARGHASAAVISGNVIDSLMVFGGNYPSIPYEYDDLWIYHNSSISSIFGEAFAEKWTKIAGGRSNGAAYCNVPTGELCPVEHSSVTMLGGIVEAVDLNKLAQQPPLVGVDGTLTVSLPDNISVPVSQQIGPFLPAEENGDSLGYFSAVRLVNGSRLVFGGVYFPEVLGPGQRAHDQRKPVPQGGTQSTSDVFISRGGAGDPWRKAPTSGLSTDMVSRFMHCSVTYGSSADETMLVWGGVRVQSASTFGQYASLLALDVSTGIWTNLDTKGAGAQAPGRFGHSCIVTGQPRIGGGRSMIVFGGALTSEANKVPEKDLSPVPDLWQYKIETFSWFLLRSAGVQPFPTMFHTANLMYNNTRMVVVGGLIKKPQSGVEQLVVANEVVVVELSAPCLSGGQDSQDACSWLEMHTPGVEHLTDIMLGRYGHSSLLSQSDEQALLVVGGIDEDDSIAPDIWQLTLTEIVPTPAPPAPTPAGDNDVLGLSWTALMLIIAGIFLSVGVSVLVFKWHRRRKRLLKTQQLLADLTSRSGPQVHKLTADDEEGGLLALGASGVHQEWERDFAEYLADAQDFVIEFDSLRVVKQIGHGATCVVHVGWWGSKPVAIKRFFLNQNFQFRDFCRETLVHRDLKHKNVLELHAITVSPPCSITPLMRFGSLFHLLQSAEPLSYMVVLQLAYDTAQGMQYLHSQGVLHRDLKTLNLLIDDNWTVKVSDFGTSRFQISAMTTGVGSVQYMAPEVFVSNHSTTKADVYSFSIILWEMITRKVPYGEVNSPFIVCCDVRNGVRLEIPDNARSEYTALITDCWAQNANERPSFQEILVRLEEMMQQETPHEHAIKLQGPRDLRGSFAEVTDLQELIAVSGGQQSGRSSYTAPNPLEMLHSNCSSDEPLNAASGLSEQSMKMGRSLDRG